MISNVNGFFVADTQLYKRLCPSVGPSVREHESKSGKMSILLAFWAAVPKGSLTYAFTHMGKFLLLLFLLLLFLLRPPPSNPSLQAQILVSRPNSQS